jgi:hypothetical protein
VPVIIATTQEAKIRRISIRSQPGQIVHQILFGKYPAQKRTVRPLSSSPAVPQKKKKKKFEQIKEHEKR